MLRSTVLLQISGKSVVGLMSIITIVELWGKASKPFPQLQSPAVILAAGEYTASGVRPVNDKFGS